MSTHIPTGEKDQRSRVETRVLQPNESVKLSASEPLSSPNPELLAESMQYGDIVAEITAGDKRFAVVDMSKLDGNNNEAIKYVLLDKPHMEGDVWRGMLVLRSDQPQKIGRAHYRKYLDYTDMVSKDHFTIVYEGEELTITNLEPTNSTTVTGLLVDTEPKNAYGQLANDRKYPNKEPFDLRRHEIKNGLPITLMHGEKEAILQKAEIHGDSFMGQKLTVDIMQQEGLEPKYGIGLQDDVACYLSEPYDIGGGRIAAVGYVDTPEGIVARTYYRSNSQGTWRYLPKYELKGNKVVWYGKGFGEESILLPLKLQSALAKISSKIPPNRIQRNPDFIFAGTAREVRNTAAGTLLFEVRDRPMQLNPNFQPTEDYAPSPESLRLTSSQSPDFSKTLDSWEQPSSVYGEIKIEVFSSNDGTMKYMFCQDDHGRAWIGGIEVRGEVGSIGLKSNWINAGMLTTPPYEYYPGQTYGYENLNLRQGPYADMFRNYLSKIPVIQEYIGLKRQ